MEGLNQGLPRKRRRLPGCAIASIIGVSLIGLFAIWVAIATHRFEERKRETERTAHVADSLQIVHNLAVWAKADSLLRTDGVSGLKQIDDGDLATASFVAEGGKGSRTLADMMRKELDRRTQRRMKEEQVAMLRAAQEEAGARLETILADARSCDGGSMAKATSQRVRSLAEKHPDWTDHEIALVARGTFTLGMTSEQLRESWGPPREINRTVVAGGTSEQWVYGYSDPRYIYVDNGVITAWQD